MRTLRSAHDQPQSTTYIALWVGDSALPVIRCLACGAELRPVRNNDNDKVRVSLQLWQRIRINVALISVNIYSRQ